MTDAAAPGQALFEAPLLHTPFHARTRAASTVDAFVPWAGYSTVDVFTTVEHEYFAIRNGCALYDLTPMLKYEITGSDAEAYLNRLLTRDVGRIGEMQVGYGIWCNDAGDVVGDGTLLRLGPQSFRLCAGEHQLDWLLASAIGFDVTVRDATAGIAALALQGPTACFVLKQLGCAGVERLRPFAAAEFAVAGTTLLVTRTGFTGDLGYELWLPPEHALDLWDALMAAGRDAGIRPIGARALNMARIEAGFAMPHVEFVPAEEAVRTGRARNPFELGLGWLVDEAKAPHFTGKRALAAARHGGERLVGLDVAGQKPAADALLYAARSCRHPIGFVTSAMWSPTAKRNIALGFVAHEHAALGSRIWADLYLCRETRWERRVVAAEIVSRPFLNLPRRRQTPPADR